MERWNPIPTAPPYEVSNLGRVRRIGATKPRALVTHKRGYQMVTLYLGSKNHCFYVHRLVMHAFVGEPGELQVNHKNGNKADNRLVNLEYVTCERNTEHAKKVLDAYRKGSTHPASKITEEAVEAIHVLGKTNNWSNSRIGRAFGISASNVSMILNGMAWAHKHPGHSYRL